MPFIISSAEKFPVKSKSKRPSITAIIGVAFYSHSVKSNKQFYKNYLGLSELPLNSIALNKGDSTAVFQVNALQSIKIIPEKQPAGSRFAYFIMETDNAEAMRRYLETKRIIVPHKPLKMQNGCVSFFVTDPNGTICQITQKKLNATRPGSHEKENVQQSVAVKMSHVGFMVADIDSAMKFYHDVLGFEETWRGSKDGKNVTWVNLKVPNGGEYIELMLYDEEPSAVNMGVLNHACLQVQDVTKVEGTLLGRSLPANCRATTHIKTGINKKRQINTFDTDGTRIEIMESNTVDGKPAPWSYLKPLKFYGTGNKSQIY
jgi:catechol 2,3-dioxygenase-like lactoylglutathione lyase family enzyme